jgi:hypothetical protein
MVRLLFHIPVLTDLAARWRRQAPHQAAHRINLSFEGDESGVENSTLIDLPFLSFLLIDSITA